MSAIDNFLVFDENIEHLSTSQSTNVIDLVHSRNIGAGKYMYLECLVKESFTDSGTDSTVTLTLETDNDSAMSSPTVLQTVAVIPAGALAGSKFKTLLPSTHDYKRYLSVKYTVANGNLTTGKVSTYLTDTDTLYKAHSDAKPEL